MTEILPPSAAKEEARVESGPPGDASLKYAVEVESEGRHEDDVFTLTSKSTMGQLGRGSDSEVGGDPQSLTEILDQIARCLPPDVRPKLLLGALELKIGDAGALEAAPRVASPVFFTREDARAADRIVQAALQCAPYNSPQFRNRTISLVPDFSAIQPKVVSASVPDDASGGRSSSLQ